MALFFVYSNKYSMKYDFSTYILNKLNETNEQKPYSTADEIKTKLNDFILDKGVIKYKDKTGKPGDKVSVDTLKEIKNGEGWKNYYKNNKSNDMIKAIIKTTTEHENKNNTIRAFDEDGFNLLGKTIAYRSALTFMNVANTSGEDFKQAAIDAFKDESEYSVKQLENLDSLLDYSAALKTVKDKEKRLNDENNKDNDKVLAKLKEMETQLVSTYKYSAIQEVKKTYGKEFQDNRDIFQKSFNDGMDAQKEEMSKPDYKWEDPVTKLPPKGFSAKANMVGDKLFKKLEAVSKKADEWIKQQKGLDWAILKLCSLGVHGLVYGGKALYKLLGKVYKRTNLKDSLRFTKKYKEVESQIDIFKKEYDEWANNKSKNKDNKEEQEGQENTEQKEDENAKNTILMKFSELLNNYVVPYYYSKLGIIVACVENIDNKYIIRQENNKWSTLNTSTGNLTIIEDNAILAQRMLETVNKKLNDAFNSFENDPCADAFKSIPQDLKFNGTYSSNYLKWIDKIKEGKIDKEKLKNLLKVYNDKIVKIQFGSYKEFFDYINNAKVAYKKCSFPTVKEITIKFNGDEDAGIPGIITGAKKEETKEEQTPEEDKEYQKILNSVEDIKNATNAEEVSKNYGDTKEKVDKAVDQIQNNIKDQEIKDYLDKHFLNIQKADTLTKMMYLNTAKSKGLFDSCVAFNYAMNMLLEDTNSSGNSSEVFKDIVNLLNGESNDNTIGDFKKKDEELKTSMEKAKEQMKDDVKKALPDDPLAVYSYLNKKEESKKLEVNVDTLIQQLERPDTDYEKLQKEYASYDKMIKDYIGKDKDKLEKYTRGSSIIKEFGDDIIPKLWFAKRYSDWVTKPKESYDPFIDYSLLFLLEDDETNNKDNKAEEVKNKIKEAHKQLDDIISADSLEPYKKWKAGIIELFKQFGDKIENKDELKDPVQMLSSMIDYMKSNESEEKKEENQQPAEEGSKSEESGEN